MAEPASHELSERIAVLEEKMNTNYAKTESALDRLRADMADWKTDMADWKTEMARRDKSNMQWIAGFVLGSAVLVIAVLGLLLTSTPAP